MNITDIVPNRHNIRRMTYNAEFVLLDEVNRAIIAAAQRGELSLEFTLENPKKRRLVVEFLTEKGYTVTYKFDNSIEIYW